MFRVDGAVVAPGVERHAQAPGKSGRHEFVELRWVDVLDFAGFAVGERDPGEVVGG